jgi:hypothetical protein
MSPEVPLGNNRMAWTCIISPRYHLNGSKPCINSSVDTGALNYLGKLVSELSESKIDRRAIGSPRTATLFHLTMLEQL